MSMARMETVSSACDSVCHAVRGMTQNLKKMQLKPGSTSIIQEKDKPLPGVPIQSSGTYTLFSLVAQSIGRCHTGGTDSGLDIAICT